jgi:hypothetical protein
VRKRKMREKKTYTREMRAKKKERERDVIAMQ